MKSEELDNDGRGKEKTSPRGNTVAKGTTDVPHADTDAATRRATGRARARRKMRNLYDVFVRIRDDEAAHWDTLNALVVYETLDVPEGCEVPELA